MGSLGTFNNLREHLPASISLTLQYDEAPTERDMIWGTKLGKVGFESEPEFRVMDKVVCYGGRYCESPALRSIAGS